MLVAADMVLKNLAFAENLPLRKQSDQVVVNTLGRVSVVF
jgi:hypothetical protein